MKLEVFRSCTLLSRDFSSLAHFKNRGIVVLRLLGILKKIAKRN